MSLFNLIATITLNSKDYEQGLRHSEKSTQSFSSKLNTAFKGTVNAIAGVTKAITAVSAAISAASGFVVKFALDNVNLTSDIDDSAKKLRMTTEQYQKWNWVLKLSGVNSDILSGAVKQLTQFTLDLKDGDADALLALQELGLGYDDFMKMDIDEQLTAIIEALQGMEDGTDKTRLAQEIFGNNIAQELIPLLDAEEGSIDDVYKKVKDLGLIISDDTVKAHSKLKEEVELLRGAWDVLKINITDYYLPELLELTGGFRDLILGVDGADEKISKGFSGIIEKTVNALPDIIQGLSTTGLQVITTILDKMTETVRNPVMRNNFKVFTKDFINTLTDTLPVLVDFLVAIIEGSVDVLTDPEVLDALWNFAKGLLNALADLIKKGGRTILAPAIEAAIGKENSDSFFDTVDKMQETQAKGNQMLWDWLTSLFTKKAEGGMITKYASGGVWGSQGVGTLYTLAGEAGAEIVAHGPRGTGVANIEQIADAQYMAMYEYGLDRMIEQAANNIVKGIVQGLQNEQQTMPQITVKIGEREFKQYIVETTNKGLQSQGRRTLNNITGY